MKSAKRLPKTRALITAYIFVFWCFSGAASASLIAQGSEYVLDTDSGLLWYLGIDDFTGMTYDQQISQIAGIGQGWHMADLTEMTTLYNLGQQAVVDWFTPTYTNFEGTHYYGRFDDSPSVNVHRFTVWDSFSGLIGLTNRFATVSDDARYSNYGAWAVKENVNPVPIPSTLFLVGSGLAALAGTRPRRG